MCGLYSDAGSPLTKDSMSASGGMSSFKLVEALRDAIVTALSLPCRRRRCPSTPTARPTAFAMHSASEIQTSPPFPSSNCCTVSNRTVDIAASRCGVSPISSQRCFTSRASSCWSGISRHYE